MKKTLNKLWPALAESRLAVALFAGLFVAAMTFLSVPPQFAARGTNALLRGSSEDGGAGSPASAETSGHALQPALADTTAEPPVFTEQAQEKDATSSPKKITGEEIAPATATATSVAQVHPPLEPICDLSDRRYDGCEMWGDARTASGVNKSVVYFIPPQPQLATAAAATWSIRSQSRKIVGVREVMVRSLDASTLHEAPRCTVRRAVPAVVFALGGLTSNYWHAFSDVLVPLFTTARAFGGDVELVATGAGASQAWFLGKYDHVLRALSRYDVVDLDADGDVVRCYRHLVVGLRGHRDFDIDPARAPNGYDMLAFREFVRAAYSLPPPPAAALPCKSGGGSGGKKPRLMLVLRGRTRRFVNEGAIVDAIERAGFEVARMDEATSAAGVGAVAREVDACDVLVGAHGAGLTNMVFLRAGAVVVQVIPWGKMEPYGEGFFGAPAAHMGLRHVAYSIAAEESTLYDRYGKDHPVITDPDVFYRNGSNAELYWREQNIRLNTTRFAPTLQMVKRMLLRE